MTDPREIVPADEMEAAYDRLQELEWHFAPLIILQAASENGLLGLLATEEAITADEAARRLELHPVVTVKVLRALAAMGMLGGEGDRFEMRPGYRPLFDPGSAINHETGLKHIFELSKMWARELPDFLRNGEWTKTPRDAASQGRFVGSMRALAYGITGRLARALDLTGTRHLVDIGGALGTYSIELCLRHPKLRATVLDVEGVAQLCRQEIEQHGLEDRMDAVVGDYLEPMLPGDMDLAMLSNVVHQESAERAAQMIERAARGLVRGGRLVVLDFTLEDSRREPLLGALFAINMRLFGDTYSEADLRGWMERAGLVDVTRTNLSPNKLFLVGRKP